MATSAATSALTAAPASAPLDLGPGAGRLPARAAAPARPRRAPPLPGATLAEVLVRRAADTPDAPAFHFVDLADRLTTLSCAELVAAAGRAAAGLRAHGVGRGDAALLCLDTGPDLAAAFFGCVLAGVVPALVDPPRGPAPAPAWIGSVERRRRICRARALVASEALAASLAAAAAGERAAAGGAGAVDGGGLRAARLLTPAALAEAATSAPGGPRWTAAAGPAASEVPCLYQFTSGTTGVPQAVTVHFAPLAANARGIGEASAWTADDLVVSWLPLYHDMGIAGLTLAPFLHGLPTVLMPPLAFVLRPDRWLWALHAFRGTVSGAPNFAYHLCATRIGAGETAGLDLSAWRLAYNGAEPVVPATLARFAERFGRHGFRADAMVPVYGLAEAVVAATFPVGRRPRVDRVDRDLLAAEGRAVPVGAGAPRAAELVAVGPPLPGHELRVVDPRGRPLAERRRGRVLFRGPSVTGGYLDAPAATRESFRDGWLWTGDLGYLAGGELYLCGREKDLIIRAGHNYHPEPLEAAAAGVDGVRAGRAAAFGVADPAAGTEQVVVVVETRLTDPERRRRLRLAVEETVFTAAGLRPDRVVVVPPRTLPRTSSGKLSRVRVRDLFLSGRLAAAGADPDAVELESPRSGSVAQ
jgi:acyl-CoA synthetase (AMP-forming)/AMP-acid ligase II